MPVKLLFAHGWGFDAAVWRRVLAHLDGHEAFLPDRGYFHRPANDRPGGDYVAVCHSLGAMRVLDGDHARCIGLVAINGFDRFAAAADVPGVAPRVVDRMIGRFCASPGAVLADFRTRCGIAGPPPVFAPAPLLEDLRLLRDGDGRAAAARFTGPILSLQGVDDPILPAAMRAGVFAGARNVERGERPGQGHLLPLTDPRFCAEAIERFVGRLA